MTAVRRARPSRKFRPPSARSFRWLLAAVLFGGCSFLFDDSALQTVFLILEAVSLALSILFAGLERGLRDSSFWLSLSFAWIAGFRLFILITPYALEISGVLWLSCLITGLALGFRSGEKGRADPGGHRKPPVI